MTRMAAWLGSFVPAFILFFHLSAQAVTEDTRSIRVSVPRSSADKSYDVEFSTTREFTDGTIVLKKTGKSPFYLVLEPGVYYMRWREEKTSGAPGTWLSQGVFYRKHPAPRFTGLKSSYTGGPVQVRWEAVPGVTWYLIDLEGPGVKLKNYVRAQEIVMETPAEGKYTVRVSTAISEQFPPDATEMSEDRVKAFVGTTSKDSTFFVGAAAEVHRRAINQTFPLGRIPFSKTPYTFSWEPVPKGRSYKVTLYQQKDGDSLMISESPNVTAAFSQQIAGVLSAGDYRWTVETQTDDAIHFGESSFTVEDPKTFVNGTQFAVHLRSGRFNYSTSLVGAETAFGSNINGFDVTYAYAPSESRTYEIAYSSDSIILRGYLSNFERITLQQKRIGKITNESHYSLNWGYQYDSSFEFLARTNAEFETGNSKRHAISFGGEYGMQLNPKTVLAFEGELQLTFMTQGGALSSNTMGATMGGYDFGIKAVYLIDHPLALSLGVHYMQDAYGYTAGNNQDVSIKHSRLLGKVGFVYMF